MYPVTDNVRPGFPAVPLCHRPAMIVLAILMPVLVALPPPARAQTSEAVPLADGQSRIRQRMAEVEQRLLELADLLQEREPVRAARLRDAVKLSRGHFIVTSMERIRLLLATERYGEAAELQGEVLKDLAGLADMLGAEQAGSELERLRAAAARLAGLIRRQSEAAAGTRELSGASPGQRQASDYLAHAEKQGRIRSETSELRSDMTGGPGAGLLGGALNLMAEAEGVLRGGGSVNVVAVQLEAARKLEAARDQVLEAIVLIEEQRSEQTRRELQEILRLMLAEQRAIRAATGEVHVLRSGGEASRALLLKVAALALRERELGEPAGKVLEMLEHDGTTTAPALTMRAVKHDVSACAAMLESRNTGGRVQSLQADIEADLQAFLDVLRHEGTLPLRVRLERARRRKQVKPSGAPLVGTLGELRLVRAAEAAIRVRTVNMEGTRDNAGQLPESGRAEAGRLADRQGALAEFLAGGPAP